MANGHPNSFYQSTSDGAYLLPFRVDMERTNAECMPAPQMDYKCDMKIINEGRFDRWNTAREAGYGASYFTRHDLPFYVSPP
jgi:phospholipase C